MRTSFFARLLNTFFIALAICLVTFSLFRHYFVPKTALIFAIFASLLLCLTLWRLKERRLEKRGVKTKELAHAERVMQTLHFASQTVVDNFFLKAVQATCPDAKLESGWIVTSTRAITPCFLSKTTSRLELFQKLEHCPDKTKKLTAFGIAFDEECAHTNMELVDGVGTYAFLKTQKIFPKTSEIKQKRVPIWKRALSRKHFIRYLGLAFLFSFSGMFVPQKKLYFICSLIVTILAVCCLFVPKKEKTGFILE